MSTNKTENCQLHAWEAGDDFLRTEFNENFAAIDRVLGEMPDNKKLRIVVGTYTGVNNSPQTIVLGFQPRVVYVDTRMGGDKHHNMILQGIDGANAAVTEDGFRVSSILNVPPDSDYPHNGASMNPYRYIALDWEE